MKIGNILKICVLFVFFYIAFFNIQNFYQGYNDIIIAFNFISSVGENINTNGDILSLNATYLRGVTRMTSSFVWLTINCILGVVIGYLYKN